MFREPIHEYSDLRRAIATRRKSLRMSQLATDWAAGVQDGYTGKLEIGLRNYGDMSLPSILGALRLELVIEPTADAPPLVARPFSRADLPVPLPTKSGRENYPRNLQIAERLRAGAKSHAVAVACGVCVDTVRRVARNLDCYASAAERPHPDAAAGDTRELLRNVAKLIRDEPNLLPPFPADAAADANNGNPPAKELT
jgi:hypothetical protein